MGFSTGSKESNRTTLSEINVTPLVDVMLVLLIIFMVTAPMMQQGIDVKLPETSNTGMAPKEDPFVIVIKPAITAAALLAPSPDSILWMMAADAAIERSVALLDGARRLLAETDDLALVKQIRDQAEALAKYTRSQKQSLQRQNDFAAMKLLAERRAGAILRGREKNRGAATRCTPPSP